MVVDLQNALQFYASTESYIFPNGSNTNISAIDVDGGKLAREVLDGTALS
jgi:hypothetical protein